MARPPAGAPPVNRSLAVPTDGRRDLAAYTEIVAAFERPDRKADILAMFGGDSKLVERFLAVAFNAIATNSDLLMNADPITIIQAVRDSATLGLEPTGLTGEGVIIRYDRVARFQPMYRGYLKRIRNTGKVKAIDAQMVYVNDEFDYGYNERGGWFNHHPAKPSSQSGLDADGKPERGDYWGAYAYARFPDGYVDLDVMPAVEVNAIRDRYAQSLRGPKAAESPWATSYSEMAKKTVVRRLCKMLPQSANDELAAAVDQLLAADAAADEAREIADREGSGRIDVSRARRAALSAVAGRGGLPALPEPTQPDASPTEAPSIPMFDEGTIPAAVETGTIEGGTPYGVDAEFVPDADPREPPLDFRE